MPEEKPESVEAYRIALAKLAGRTEAWALAELAELRAELGVRSSTHDRLMAELAPASDEPIGVWIDAGPFADFRAGEQCMLRLRVVNRTERPIASLELAGAVTASTEALRASSDRVVGPDDEEILAVWFRPAVAGHHRVDATIEVVTLRGVRSRWALQPDPFLIGAAAALQQQIHIDAGAQRVGVFENIGGASKGGLVTHADWRPVRIRPATEAPPAVADAVTERPLPESGTGVVIAAGDPPRVALEGVEGLLVELHDPALRGVLGPGDRLSVRVIGRDASGRPLLSSRMQAGAAGPAPGRGGTLVVAEGDDLAEILRSAPTGARIELRGTHQGPISIDRALEIEGADKALITSQTGPAIRIGADVVMRKVTVRGAAPAGHYAVDAIEVRSGRVILDRCAMSSDAPGNLVPGRAVAIAGAADVELQACRIEGSGIGVAVDVSWSGFATETARGARIRLLGCELVGVGTGVAVAGADREVRVVRTRFAGIAEAAVRVLGRGTCAVEDCAVPKRLLVADAGANLVVRGGAR